MMVATVAASAQVYVGGGVNFSSSKPSHAKDIKVDTRTSFGIAPEIGYKLDDKLSVGMYLGYNHSKEGNVKTDAFDIKPYARYTFAKFGAVSLFADITAGVQSYKIKGLDSQTGWQAGVKPGVRVNLAKNVDFVAHCGFLGYRDADDQYCSYGTNGFGFNLDANNLVFGINYRF